MHSRSHRSCSSAETPCRRLFNIYTHRLLLQAVVTPSFILILILIAPCTSFLLPAARAHAARPVVSDHAPAVGVWLTWKVAGPIRVVHHQLLWVWVPLAANHALALQSLFESLVLLLTAHLLALTLLLVLLAILLLVALAVILDLTLFVTHLGSSCALVLGQSAPLGAVERAHGPTLPIKVVGDDQSTE
mmetsp:Transcript_20748/g.66038  ORF Transcript_20748/g.66038 Transcript_20748/m.66038 type:complete len:189 (-) Transcript_20748:263-829(-)